MSPILFYFILKFPNLDGVFPLGNAQNKSGLNIPKLSNSATTHTTFQLRNVNQLMERSKMRKILFYLR